VASEVFDILALYKSDYYYYYYKRWTSDLLTKVGFLGFGCRVSGIPNPVIGSMKSVHKVLVKWDGHWQQLF